MDEAFLDALQGLKSQRCWSIKGSRGGALAMSFGQMIKRRKPLTNPQLTQQERDYDGELNLFIRCAWRLDDASRVLGIWSDEGEVSRKIPRGLDPLVDAEVTAVAVMRPAYDLNLLFPHGLTLRLFCDRSGGDDDDDYNYFLSCLSGIYTVCPNGRITFEEHFRA
jgi:hypothetical protein